MAKTMNNPIERLDRKRRVVLRTYLFGAAIFFASWIIRFTLREIGALTGWLDWAIAIPFGIGLIILIYSFLELNQIRRKMAADPALKEALNDELVRLNNLTAFKYGFFAMLSGLVFFAVFNFLSPIKDFNGVLLTLFLVGAWGYLLAFYRLDRG
jgi:predicted membrane channel-forming protein YqfA (hemolysin III family)